MINKQKIANGKNLLAILIKTKAMITFEDLKTIYRDLKTQVNPNQDTIDFIHSLEELFNWVGTVENYHAARNADLDALCSIIDEYRKAEATRMKESCARIIFMYPDNLETNDLKN